MFYRVYDTLCSFTRNVEVIRSFEKGIGFTNITIFFTSGGTDIISCFVGQNPTVPVYRGEIQTRNLGMAVESWNDEGVWGNPFIFFFFIPSRNSTKLLKVMFLLPSRCFDFDHT